jgi:glycosyltransferase involved in cell wall biosynthesis
MLGGVEKYYLKIRDKFTEQVSFYTIGRRPGEEGLISQIVRMMLDYARFIVVVLKNRYALIHINPSIEPKSFIREGIFHLLARLLRRKTLIFFRGWHISFQERLERRLWLFRLLYAHADAYIVLSSDFRKLIQQWGITGPIYREVTIADDDELNDFDMTSTLAMRERSAEHRILFAARVTRDKGIYELIDAVSMLQEKYHRVQLIVAGDSPELPEVKAYAAQKALHGVLFAGYVVGEEKDQLFKTSHVFCMPTYYEGFPNVVVEAMAVGLPVVTRSTGGLKDFFVNGFHGFITESKDPQVFAGFLERLVTEKELYRQISLNNYRYAQDNFLASRAAQRLQMIYRSVIDGREPNPAVLFSQGA